MAKAKFTGADIQKYLIEYKERIETAMLLRLQRIGESFVTDARNNDTYKDRTGNLRSSIYYMIYKDGVRIAGEQTPSITTHDDSKFVSFDELILTKHPLGFVLIVRAGMSYAAAVEAKGFDVITGAGLIAKDALIKSMEQLKKKIS